MTRVLLDMQIIAVVCIEAWRKSVLAFRWCEAAICRSQWVEALRGTAAVTRWRAASVSAASPQFR
jgi:hypothetical protein